MKEKILSKKIYIVLALVLLLEAVLMLFWATMKQNCFIDELYSFGYAHYFTDRTPLFTYINDTELWQNSTWIDASDLKALMTVTKDNSVLSGSIIPGYILKTFLKGKNYMGILNIINSVSAPGIISMRGAVIFNIFCLMLTLIIMFFIIKELTEDDKAALLGVIIYGTSGLAINMTEYVRFYDFTILLIMLALYLHMKMWNSDRVLRNLIYELLSLILIFFSYNNTDLSAAVGGLIILGFGIGLLLRKRISQFLYYFLPLCFGGIGFLMLFTKLPKLILHPEDYVGAGGTWGWVAGNFTSLSFSYFKEQIKDLFDILIQYFFGHRVILINYAVIILLLAVYKLAKKKEAGLDAETETNKNSSFGWVLLFVFVCYTIFAAFIGLSKAVRYYSFVYSILCILLVTLLSCLWKNNSFREYITGLLFILAIGGGVLTSVNHDIEYLYLEEKEAMDILEDYEYVDIVMESQENDQAARHAIYDCIYNAGENVKICPVTYAECNIDFSGCSDTLLIWTHTGKNVANCDIFIENGYSVEKLCSTHTSDIFVARR